MERLKNLTPPGTDGMKTIQIIAVLWVLAAIELMARFAVYFPMVLGPLPWSGGTTYVELPVYQNGFGTLMGVVFTHAISAAVPVPPLAGLGLILYLLIRGIANEQSYWQGSRADYTMKRLPDKWERHRRAWALPAIGLIGLAVIYLIVTLVCHRVFGVYIAQ